MSACARKQRRLQEQRESSALPPAHGRHSASPRTPSWAQGSRYPRTRKSMCTPPSDSEPPLKPISTSVIHKRRKCFPRPGQNNHRTATPKPRRVQTAARSSAACAAQLSRAHAWHGAALRALRLHGSHRVPAAAAGESGRRGAFLPRRGTAARYTQATCGWLYNPSAGGRD